MKGWDGRRTVWAIAALLFFSGLGISFYQPWWNSSRTWRVFRTPIQLESRQVETPEFTVNVDTTFVIDVSIDFAVSKAASRELGIEYHVENGDRIVPPVSFKWTAIEDGKPFKSGGDGGWFVGTRQGRHLGTFPVRRGHTYRVIVDIYGKAFAARALHPEMSVHVEHRAYDMYVMDGALKTAGGFILAGSGLLVAVVAAIFSWWKRKRPTAFTQA